MDQRMSQLLKTINIIQNAKIKLKLNLPVKVQ